MANSNHYTPFIEDDEIVESKPLVLVIEDEHIIANLLKHKLSKSSYRVEHREDGVQGLEAARELRPDLILLDVMLPQLSGFEVLRQLREDESTKDIKVMMLTAMSQEEDLKRGFQYKVDEYMTKPFKVSELMMRLEKVLAL